MTGRDFPSAWSAHIMLIMAVAYISDGIYKLINERKFNCRSAVGIFFDVYKIIWRYWR